MSANADHQALLASPVGQPGSGGVRYAAAMFLYTQGQMPPDMLEIYRRCCKFDHEDPVAVARYEGVALPAVLKDAP